MQIDLEILKKCAENDRLAQKKLYEQCFHLFMPLCYSFTSNEEDARHLLNLGFLKICQNIQKIDLETIAFYAWSKRIIKNAIIDDYRKNKKHKEHLQGVETERELENYNRINTNAAENNFALEDIKKLIEKLPATTKSVFMLFTVEGYSHKEIGDMLEINEGTSKWHLSNGKKLLRSWLIKSENETYFEKRMVV